LDDFDQLSIDGEGPLGRWVFAREAPSDVRQCERPGRL